MTYLKTIKEIKSAVDEGKTVYCDSEAYEVRRYSNYKSREYYIVCTSNDYVIGLHGKEGTEYEHKLNGNKFFTKEAA